MKFSFKKNHAKCETEQNNNNNNNNIGRKEC